jgi:hypothetical protein
VGACQPYFDGLMAGEPVHRPAVPCRPREAGKPEDAVECARGNVCRERDLPLDDRCCYEAARFALRCPPSASDGIEMMIT